MWLSLSPVFPSSGPAMEQLFLLSQTTQTIDVSIITALKLPLTANGHTFVHQQQCKRGGALLHCPWFYELSTGTTTERTTLQHVHVVYGV